MSNLTWTDKSGEEHEIEDMETSHIENCMAMIKRNGFRACSFIEGVDPDAVRDYYFGLEEEDLRPVYYTMKTRA
jgi:hypothetical protein